MVEVVAVAWQSALRDLFDKLNWPCGTRDNYRTLMDPDTDTKPSWVNFDARSDMILTGCCALNSHYIYVP